MKNEVNPIFKIIVDEIEKKVSEKNGIFLGILHEDRVFHQNLAE